MSNNSVQDKLTIADDFLKRLFEINKGADIGYVLMINALDLDTKNFRNFFSSNININEVGDYLQTCAVDVKGYVSNNDYEHIPNKKVDSND